MSALYAYLLTAPRPKIPACAAVEQGGRLAVLESGDLCVVVSRVEASAYSADALRERAAGGWLEEQVCRHHAVVDAVFQQQTVMPLRFGTLFSGVASLRRELTGRAAALREHLHFLEDREEWDLQVLAAPRPQPAAAEVDQGAAAPGGAASPGRSYLHRRQRELSARQSDRTAALAATDQAVRAAGALAARAVAALYPPARPASGPCLHAVYLVERAGQGALLDAAAAWQRSLSPAGLNLRLTGPWPPYHFTSAPAGATA